MAINRVFSPTDTIVAVATPSGRGGIGVIRISGSRAAEIAGAVLTPPLPDVPRHATLTRVAGRVDEVVATWFPAPHSYTTEDVVEISAHGSAVVLREIVRLAMAAGARLAERGEFTFRAFLGGRLDLVQAEAVGDLVDAVTSLQARVAFDQLDGTLTRAIVALDTQLFDLVVRLEASLDFPDEGYHFIEPAAVASVLGGVRDGIGRLLASARSGRVIREGRQVAIVGKPNVGKSSLFNWLVGSDRAIVTSIPGTTRDLLRESIDFEGVRLSLVDTAGIRDVQDEIEREGVSRARQAPEVADLVFVVLDASRPLDDSDGDVLALTAAIPRLVVVNKIDQPCAWSKGDGGSGVRELTAAIPQPVAVNRIDRARAWSSEDGGIGVSLKSGAGLDVFRKRIEEALQFVEPRVEDPQVTNMRHEALLRVAHESVARALRGVQSAGDRLSEEFVLADLSSARRAFDEVVGKRTTEDVLRTIFERFCIGK
jgi:tRNA modification GTPase